MQNQVTAMGVDTVFEPVYAGTLYNPFALNCNEGREMREVLMQFCDLPANIGKLLSVLGDEKSDAKMVADVAELNPAVAAKILRIVNSSYSGLRGRITNLKRAVTLLGYDNVRALILGMGTFTEARGRQLPEEVPLGKLWTHSAAVGHIAGVIARKLGGLDTATLLSGGLLHDAGKLVMASAFRERYAKVVRLSLAREGNLLDLELSAFGLTHPIVSAALCHMWNLPERLWGLIAAQEHPALGPDVTMAACLKLAEFVSRSHSIGADGQWAHGFVPEDICWYLEKTADEVNELICPAEVRTVIEGVSVTSSWE